FRVKYFQKVFLAIVFQTVPTLSFSLINVGLVLLGIKWLGNFGNPKLTGELVYFQIFVNALLRII
ncbi:MAG: hypothetical protein GWN31_13035, partial [Candidatus Thorarchaeota archaeon]|nr:hypothetical protein [Candidatus Thorarchaeota archaeon]NIW14819.1 hypothetical protein [Candidatus Thorarchaeota archaeon]